METKPVVLHEYEVIFYAKNREVVVKYIWAESEADALNKWDLFYRSVHSNGVPPFFLQEVVRDEFLQQQYIVVGFSNGTHWKFPIYFIANNHAKTYVARNGGEVGRTLIENTLPYFKASQNNILAWIKQMTWAELQKNAQQVQEYDYDVGLETAQLVM